MNLSVKLLCLLVVVGWTIPPARASTWYIAPHGDDGNSGASAAAPLNTFDHAIHKLQPGDTLILENGAYTVANSGEFYARGGHNARNGTAAAPITVRAAHERQAWIRGDGRFPFRLQNVDWWNIQGLHVSSRDRPEKRGVQRGEPFLATRCNHLTIRRLLADHNNRYVNCAGVGITQCQHVLVLESELYYFHRNGFQAFQCDDVTLRRCYANSRGYSDIRGGYGSHHISPHGGDGTFVSYYSSNVTIENCVSEFQNEGFDDISGKDTIAGEPSGDNYQVLGSISLNDYRPASLGPRKKPKKYGGTGKYQPITNARFKNFLVIGAKKKGFISRAAHDATLENITIINGRGNEAFHANTDHQEIGGRTFWPSNEEVGGSKFRLRNWLIINQHGKVLTGVEPNSNFMDFLLAYSNLTNTPIGKKEPIGDDAGQIQHCIRKAPTGLGLRKGQAIVYIPDGSNMKGAGKDGADIGANILHRYVDGKLTDKLLWNPRTGQFPHGAMVQGLNDIPGKSLFDLNERLNVTPRTLAHRSR